MVAAGIARERVVMARSRLVDDNNVARRPFAAPADGTRRSTVGTRMLTVCLSMCSTVDPVARGGEGYITGSGKDQDLASQSFLPMFRVPPVLQWVRSADSGAVGAVRPTVVGHKPLNTVGCGL